MHVAHFRPPRLVAVTLLAAVLAVALTLALATGIGQLSGLDQVRAPTSPVTASAQSLSVASPWQPAAAAAPAPLVRPFPMQPFEPIRIPFRGAEF